ncbi:MAG: serine/threonine protein kinase [candidate division Zixibacteria bacterium]|nr:serine/threonine protein kinase [candidate division Zixibacteria bacterium]
MNSQTVQIGRFTGIPVAEGGFATVYRAFDDVRGISVAMKLAHPDADNATIASLHHEFNLLGEFDYLQVPRALEFEWDHRRPCLITDWIDGPEIWDRSHTNSVELFVTALRQIARALTFVHHRGWVHGDLKPGNFRWGAPRATSCRSASANEADSILYLLDFGLARPVGDTDRPRGAGTVGYYAPEFLQRIPADGRADWYSIGAMLYEWVYGRRPFEAENPADEIAGHLEQSPNWDTPFVRPVPEWTRDVIARLLQKSPEQRGDDVYDLLGWLGQFDSELRPEVILNEQASAHLSSEWRRADDHDRALIAQIVDASTIHRKARWTISADHVDTDRIARGITNAVLEKVPGSRVTLGQLSSAPNTSEATRSGIQQLRMCVEEPDGGHDVSIVEYTPFANMVASGSGPSESDSVCSITLLPWGLEQVKARLSGLTRDDAFVAASAATILRATGGVPAAVFDLLTRVVTTGMLKRSADGWHLDDSAVLDWQSSPDTGTVYNEYLGSLTADERRLCDVVAVGRALIHFSHLRELAGLSEGRFEAAFGRLVVKGVMVRDDHDAAGDSSLIRLRLNGLADVWRAQLPEAYRRSIAASVAERLRSIGADPDRRTYEVLAECYADSAQWENCVEYSVAAANANMKIEDHAGAMRFIGLAGSAAGNIADRRSNAYWRGRALMVRGDYQKSIGQIDDARHVYREILALGRHHGDYLLLAETLKDLGDLYRMTRRRLPAPSSTWGICTGSLRIASRPGGTMNKRWNSRGLCRRTNWWR